MAKPGPESLLNDELTLKIRKLVLDGQNYENIKKILEIADGTWDSWVYNDYKDLRANLINWKHERMIKNAEVQIEVLQFSEDEKVALNANTFVLETLGKKRYSKRSEVTGEDGKPVMGNAIVFTDFRDGTEGK